MTALYICYQTIDDPLTQTQVVAYLEGLTQSGYKIVLLTYEAAMTAESRRKAETELSSKGIVWRRLRYHKLPTVPATAWDIAAGLLYGLWLSWRHQVKLVHARSHVPGVISMLLKRLMGLKFLFDVRGLMAEEYVDAGIWPADGWLFRSTKRMERLLIQHADGIIVLTEKARNLLNTWYHKEIKNKPLEVIPCCVHVNKQHGAFERSHKNGHLTFCYVGKLGGWYLTQEMADFMALSLDMVPHLNWQVWTQSDASPLQRLLQERGIKERVEIGQVSSHELPARLQKADAGVSFIRPCQSKLASSPTKVGEYLAAGLPVIATRGIGDLDQLLEGNGEQMGRVGVLVEHSSTPAMKQAVQSIINLIKDPQTPQRCRRVAEEHFDLTTVGRPRYRRMYEALIGRPPQ